MLYLYLLMSPDILGSETFPDQVDCIIEIFSTSFDFAQTKTNQHGSFLLRVLRGNETGDLGGV